MSPYYGAKFLFKISPTLKQVVHLVRRGGATCPTPSINLSPRRSPRLFVSRAVFAEPSSLCSCLYRTLSLLLLVVVGIIAKRKTYLEIAR